MGLAAAFHAVKAGHTVEVLEAAREPGGMAAHFDLGDYPSSVFTILYAKATLQQWSRWMNWVSAS
jgi:phytoene dehydrogenase-like protein